MRYRGFSWLVLAMTGAACGGGAGMGPGAGGTAGTVVGGANGRGGLGGGAGGGPVCSPACASMEACVGGQCVSRMTDFPILLPDTPGGVGSPEDITTGPDGNLWFTDLRMNAIGRMTPDGNTTEFPLATPTSYPQGLAVGPDGRIWFAEYLGARIGAITTAGVITEYPLPSGLTGSDQVVSGPGGNVWFLASGGIGFFSTAGVGTLVAGPAHATSEDSGIAVGPDGNLWTVGFDAIYRTTPNGTTTKLPVASDEQPVATRIARGPDGNLWFTEDDGTKQGIGRMTPDGTATEFPLLPAVSFRYARDIVSAPDGNLWFTEPKTGVSGDPNAAAIGRITPDGTITEFSFDGYPNGMTVGPDGNLWYTDPNAFKNRALRSLRLVAQGHPHEALTRRTRSGRGRPTIEESSYTPCETNRSQFPSVPTVSRPMTCSTPSVKYTVPGAVASMRGALGSDQTEKAPVVWRGAVSRVTCAAACWPVSTTMVGVTTDVRGVTVSGIGETIVSLPATAGLSASRAVGDELAKKTWPESRASESYSNRSDVAQWVRRPVSGLNRASPWKSVDSCVKKISPEPSMTDAQSGCWSPSVHSVNTPVVGSRRTTS